MKNGFTIIELVVSVAIMTVLSLIVLFTISQYTNKAKDSNIAGNLAVLVPAGEAYYNVENSTNGDGYKGFCSSFTVNNIFNQLAVASPTDDCPGLHPGLCCSVNASDGSSWMACTRQATNTQRAFCVDSRGVKREICNSSCIQDVFECPLDNLSTCQ